MLKKYAAVVASALIFLTLLLSSCTEEPGAESSAADTSSEFISEQTSEQSVSEPQSSEPSDISSAAPLTSEENQSYIDEILSLIGDIQEND